MEVEAEVKSEQQLEFEKKISDRSHKFMNAIYMYCEENGIKSGLVHCEIINEHVQISIPEEVGENHEDALIAIAQKYEEGSET